MKNIDLGDLEKYGPQDLKLLLLEFCPVVWETDADRVVFQGSIKHVDWILGVLLKTTVMWPTLELENHNPAGFLHIFKSSMAKDLEHFLVVTN